MNIGSHSDSEDIGESASVTGQQQQRRSSSRHLMFGERRSVEQPGGNNGSAAELGMHRLSSDSEIVSFERGSQLLSEKLKATMNGILREAEDAWSRVEGMKKTGRKQLEAWSEEAEGAVARMRGVGSEELLNCIAIEIGKRQFAEIEIDRLKKQNLQLSSRLHVAEVEVYNAHKNVILKTRSKFDATIEELIMNEKRLTDRIEGLKVLKPQNESLRQQLAAAQKKATTLEHSLAEANKTIANLQHQTDCQNRKIESLDGEKTKLHELVRSQKEENEDLKQGIKYLESELQTLQKHFDDLKRTYENQEAKYKRDAETHEKELERKMAKYKEELREKLQSTLEERTRKQEAAVEEMQRKVRAAEDEGERVCAEMDREQRRRRDAEGKVQQYEANFERIRLKIIEEVRHELARNFRGMVDKIGQVTSIPISSRQENADAIRALISTMELDKENRNRSHSAAHPLHSAETSRRPHTAAGNQSIFRNKHH